MVMLFKAIPWAKFVYLPPCGEISRPWWRN